MDSFLSHSGILGMKWGVRRYQNKDGSLTPAGKRRLANKEIQNERKELRSNIRSMTNEDIKKMTERLQSEKRLRDLVDDDLNPGKREVEQILKTIGKTTLTVAGTAVAVTAIKLALDGKFNPDLHYTTKDYLKEAAKLVVLKKK